MNNTALEKNNIWNLVFKMLIAALTAAATSFGLAACR